MHFEPATFLCTYGSDALICVFVVSKKKTNEKMWNLFEKKHFSSRTLMFKFNRNTPTLDLDDSSLIMWEKWIWHSIVITFYSSPFEFWCCFQWKCNDLNETRKNHHQFVIYIEIILFILCIRQCPLGWVMAHSITHYVAHCNALHCIAHVLLAFFQCICVSFVRFQFCMLCARLCVVRREGERLLNVSFIYAREKNQMKNRSNLFSFVCTYLLSYFIISLSSSLSRRFCLHSSAF